MRSAKKQAANGFVSGKVNRKGSSETTKQPASKRSGGTALPMPATKRK